MNICRRTACAGDWSSGFNTLFTKPRTDRCPRTAPSRGWSRTPASRQAPGSNAGEKPQLRAIDLARKVREEKTVSQAAGVAVSALERRVTELKRFSLQLQNVHPNVLAKHLHRSVLYQDKHVVVINKPHGVPVRGKQVVRISTGFILTTVKRKRSCYTEICGTA